jgi:hypothetical protein
MSRLGRGARALGWVLFLLVVAIVAIVSKALANAIGKLVPVVRFHLSVGQITIDLADSDPALLPGDEVELRITARIVAGTFSEKYQAKANEFVGPRTYRAQAVVREGSVVRHRARAEIDREFSKRMGAPGA